jgi:hypothetical protein
MPSRIVPPITEETAPLKVEAAERRVPHPCRASCDRVGHLIS